MATVSESFSGMFAVTYTAGSPISIKNTTANMLTGRGAIETMTDAGANPIHNGGTLTGTTNSGGIKATFTYIGAVEQGTTFIGILVEDTANSKYYLLTKSDTGTTFSGGGGGSTTLTPLTGEGWTLPAGTPACFMAGTAVRTPSGDVAVETLKTGDLVSLSDGRAAPVSWLGRQSVSMVFADPLRVLPIRIKAGALGENLPTRDLLLSADHALLVDGVLIQAGALVNGVSILRETQVPTVFTYYHVEVADHSLILTENVPAETFVDNVDRMGFDNWAEHEALYGDAVAIVEMDYPRAKSARQVPQATRNRLMALATAMYGKELAAA